MAPRVATVGGRAIPLSRVEERLSELRRGPRGRHLPPEGWSASVDVQRWIVHELVTEAVLAHEAGAAGIDDEQSAPSRTTIAGLVERVTASVTVPDAELRAFYDRNPDLYRRPEARRVRHILAAHAMDARQVVRRLEAGEGMESLARSLSTDTGSRETGGDLGEVRRGELTGALEDAIFASEVGAIVGPCETEHGWHVARVEAIIPESSAPYSEVRPAIEAELLAAARTRVFGEWLEGRRKALAVVEPAFAHPADPIHGVSSHRH